MEKTFFQFEIIINVLVISFWFIWIPMLWVCDHYKYFNSFSAGTVFIRQNLPSTDVRSWRLKSVPALKELTGWNPNVICVWHSTVAFLVSASGDCICISSVVWRSSKLARNERHFETLNLQSFRGQSRWRSLQHLSCGNIKSTLVEHIW